MMNYPELGISVVVIKFLKRAILQPQLVGGKAVGNLTLELPRTNPVSVYIRICTRLSRFWISRHLPLF